mmetsp:Transcript_12459/g.37595  ORF Transcript_12459/g.37595 Transcript_12459/m.37595 type:complete len:255 (+) Transcript_12459:544-1308(+)
MPRLVPRIVQMVSSREADLFVLRFVGNEDPGTSRRQGIVVREGRAQWVIDRGHPIFKGHDVFRDLLVFDGFLLGEIQKVAFDERDLFPRRFDARFSAPRPREAAAHDVFVGRRQSVRIHSAPRSFRRPARLVGAAPRLALVDQDELRDVAALVESVVVDFVRLDHRRQVHQSSRVLFVAEREPEAPGREVLRGNAFSLVAAVLRLQRHLLALLQRPRHARRQPGLLHAQHQLRLRRVHGAARKKASKQEEGVEG